MQKEIYYVAYEGTKNNPTAFMICCKKSLLETGEIIYKENVKGAREYNNILPSINQYIARLNT